MTKFRHSLNARQAADILGRDPRQAIRYAKDGLVDAIKMDGRTGSWIFNEASVRSYAATLVAMASTSLPTPRGGTR